MKVTFVMYGAWFAQGGMEKYNRRLIRALSELPGVEGRVFSVLDAPSAPSLLPFRTGKGKKSAVMEAVAGHLMTGRPNHLILGHVDFLPLAALARVVAPFCKVTVLANGPEVWGDASHRRTPGWEALLARRAPHHIAALSEVTLRRMSRRHGIPRKRFVLLPQAVDGIHDDPPRRHGNNLLTVARLGVRDVNKGVGLVIRAMPRLLERFPALRYRIVGAGPLVEPLWEFAIQMGVHRRVEFLGPLDDTALAKVYRDTDIVVLPSKKEGSGLAFLEAWSYGLPVIGGADDAAAWLIKDGETGLTAPPGHVAAAIHRLLVKPQAAREMGRKGREQIPGVFDHDAFRTRLAAHLGVAETVAAPPPQAAALPEMDEADWEPVAWTGDTPAADPAGLGGSGSGSGHAGGSELDDEWAREWQARDAGRRPGHDAPDAADEDHDDRDRWPPPPTSTSA